jgi:hypothetical protein
MYHTARRTSANAIDNNFISQAAQFFALHDHPGPVSDRDAALSVPKLLAESIAAERTLDLAVVLALSSRRRAVRQHEGRKKHRAETRRKFHCHEPPLSGLPKAESFASPHRSRSIAKPWDASMTKDNLEATA